MPGPFAMGITEELLDARSLWLTPNTVSVYQGCWLEPSEKVREAALEALEICCGGGQRAAR